MVIISAVRLFPSDPLLSSVSVYAFLFFFFSVDLQNLLAAGVFVVCLFALELRVCAEIELFFFLARPASILWVVWFGSAVNHFLNFSKFQP